MTAPTASGTTVTKTAGQSTPLTSLFTYSDVDNDIVAFAVKDREFGGGYLTRDGVQLAENTLFDNIPIGEIGRWAFVAGSAGSTSTIGFNAIDRTGAFNPSATSTVNVAAATNHTPTASGTTVTKSAGESTALNSLFTYSDVDNDIVAFAVKDREFGGGYLTRDGVKQTENALFDNIPIGEIGRWAFVAGSSGSTSTVGFNAIDDNGAFNASVTSTVNVAAAPTNHTPTAAGTTVTKAAGQSTPLTSLFSYSDVDNDIVAFAVKDRELGGGYLTRDGVKQTENALFDNIPIGEIGRWAFVAGSSGSTSTVGFNAIDDNGAFNPSVVSTINVAATPTNHTPTAAGTTATKNAGESTALNSLFSYSDVDNDIVAFAVKDRELGGGYLTRDGVKLTENILFDNIPIGEIGRWAFVAGSSGSTSTVGFNAIDDDGAFNPSVISTINVAATPTNHTPTASGTTVTKNPGESTALNSLFSYSDVDNDIVAFAVKDRELGGGYLTRDGVKLTENILFDNIPIGEIGRWAFVAGPSGSTSKPAFNAIDDDGAFSPSVTSSIKAATVTAPINHTPTASGTTVTKNPGESTALTSLFTFSDVDNDIVAFAVKDRELGGGCLTRDGVKLTENILFDNIPIGEIGRWAFVAGPSGSTSKPAFNAIDDDGAFSPSVTSSIKAATVTASTNHAPTASGTAVTKNPGESTALASLFTFSDVDNDIVAFAVKDRELGGGYLTKNGVKQTENLLFDNIPIGEIAQWTFVAGPSGSTSKPAFNAIDDDGAFSPSVTSSIKAATVTASTNHAPTAVGTTVTKTAGESTALTSLFTFSDVDNDIVAFNVKDRDVGGGYLTKNGVAQAENTLFNNIPIGEIGQWAFVAGTGGWISSVGFNAIDDNSVVTPSAVSTVKVPNPNPASEIPVLLPFNAPDSFTVTQGFQTNDPSHDAGSWLQWSVDFGIVKRPVYAVAQGTIVAVEGQVADGKDGNSHFGNYITMQTDDGIYITYAHLKFGSLVKSNGTPWQVNDVVQANQVIAKSGDTGTLDEFGVPHAHLHLHFGTRLDDTNPNGDPYFDATVADGSLDATQPVYFTALGSQFGVHTGDVVSGNTAAQVTNYLLL